MVSVPRAHTSYAHGHMSLHVLDEFDAVYCSTFVQQRQSTRTTITHCSHWSEDKVLLYCVQAHMLVCSLLPWLSF